MGYKTCHALNSSLDSTICAKDCNRLKKHKFAKDCKNKGGLYKCCIRRDKAFCHECRYRYQVSGIRYQVSGISCQVSSLVRYQLSVFRSQVSGIRYQVLGIRYQVSGIRSPA